MKIWIDILTPKQLLFFEPIIERLQDNHKVLCTSRNYGEVSKLAKIRKINLKLIGKHGGKSKPGKLSSSINRMKGLMPKIEKFNPDIVISFCSPEAARIAFGLGIRHVVFCDSPHATAVMKLTVPLIEKMLIPWIIPKNEFLKYGIKRTDIIHYKAIDAALTIKNPAKGTQKVPIKKGKKNIIIRVEEEQASYATKNKLLPIIEQIVSDHNQENIIILSRYSQQTKKLKNSFGKKAKIIEMSIDGRTLLKKADVFVGSGGTMTAEAALMGVPTISYNAVPNLIEDYLVKQKLAKRLTNPKQVSKTIKNFLDTPQKLLATRAKKILDSMEDPYKKLMPLLTNS